MNSLTWIIYLAGVAGNLLPMLVGISVVGFLGTAIFTISSLVMWGEGCNPNGEVSSVLSTN